MCKDISNQDQLPSRVKVALRLTNELKELDYELRIITSKIKQGHIDQHNLERLRRIEQRLKEIEHEIELLVSL